MCPSQSFSGRNGGVNIGGIIGSVGGNIVGHDNITYGLSPEQVRELTEATAKGAVLPLAEKIAELSGQLGVSQGAMRTILATVGQANVPDERLVEKLAEVFEQMRENVSEAHRTIDQLIHEYADVISDFHKVVERAGQTAEDVKQLRQESRASDQDFGSGSMQERLLAIITEKNNIDIKLHEINCKRLSLATKSDESFKLIANIYPGSTSEKLLSMLTETLQEQDKAAEIEQYALDVRRRAIEVETNAVAAALKAR
jgi:hypothetical protein